ncbi:hypothetical protein SFC57_13115 [Niallia circulans]
MIIRIMAYLDFVTMQEVIFSHCLKMREGIRFQSKRTWQKYN